MPDLRAMPGDDTDQIPPHERRKHARMAVHWRGDLTSAEEQEDCFVLDISASGARVQCANPFEGQDLLTLAMPQGEAHDATVVWRQGSFMGLQFADESEPRLAA